MHTLHNRLGSSLASAWDGPFFGERGDGGDGKGDASIINVKFNAVDGDIVTDLGLDNHPLFIIYLDQI